MKHLKPIAAIFGVILIAACQSENATVEGPSYDPNLILIESVRLETAGDETQVKIAANQDVKYNVFKLSDPERVVVDLIDSQLAKDIPTEVAGAAFVENVKVSTIEDSLSKLVRLEVNLKESGNYLASLDGKNLMVRMMPTALAKDFPEVAPTSGALPPPPADGSPLADFSTPNESTAVPPLPEEKLELPKVEGDMAGTPPVPEITPPAADLEVGPTPMPVPLPMPLETPTAEAPPSLEAPPAFEAPMAAPDASANAEVNQPEMKVPDVVAAPVPLIEDAPVAKKDERTKVIVEPEGGPINLTPVDTQEVPTTALTEGTSLLSELGSKIYTGKRVSFEFVQAEVGDVLRLIAEVAKLNIVLSDEVKGKVTLKLVDVPWDQALDIVLTSKGLDKIQSGNILRVAPIDALKKEREVALANDKAAKQLEPIRLKLFNINYAGADEMAKRIQNILSDRGKVDIDKRTNTLIVEDIGEKISRIENLIKVLDTQTPQVRIEARIVQAEDSFERNIGIKWGPAMAFSKEQGSGLSTWPRDAGIGGTLFDRTAGSVPGTIAVDTADGGGSGTLGFRLGRVSDAFNLDLQLRYLEQESLGRIVSRPSITVLDNKTARIIQGSRIAFTSSSNDGTNTQFQEAGIEISVTPQITNDGAVVLQVSTKSNEPGQDVGGQPSISIREADTELLVKSAQTAVLGGVFKTNETKSEGGVPGLKDIPILGYLFKSKRRTTARTETLIFITPYILADNRTGRTAPYGEDKVEP